MNLNELVALQNLFQPLGLILAGGAVTRMLSDEEEGGDADFWGPWPSINEAINLAKEQVGWLPGTDRSSPTFCTRTGMVVQLCTTGKGGIPACINEFDIVANCLWMDPYGGIQGDQEAKDQAKAKIIRVQNRGPQTKKRVLRYMDRGWAFDESTRGVLEGPVTHGMLLGLPSGGQ